jgi:hypothetical protein
VRCHDDQIAAQRFGGLGNPFCGMTVRHMEAVIGNGKF